MIKTPDREKVGVGGTAIFTVKELNQADPKWFIDGRTFDPALPARLRT
jgi:hypothetical protein